MAASFLPLQSPGEYGTGVATALVVVVTVIRVAVLVQTLHIAGQMF